MTRLRRLLDLYRARWGRLEVFVIVGWILIGGCLWSLCAPACSAAGDQRAADAIRSARAVCAGLVTDAGVD